MDPNKVIPDFFEDSACPLCGVDKKKLYAALQFKVYHEGFFMGKPTSYWAKIRARMLDLMIENPEEISRLGISTEMLNRHINKVLKERLIELGWTPPSN